jgi:hypothetical protein
MDCTLNTAWAADFRPVPKNSAWTPAEKTVIYRSLIISSFGWKGVRRMKWLGMTVLAVVAAGCCCNTPGQAPVDPFYGHLTVPPPGTGAVTPQPANPYYQPPNGMPPPSGLPPPSGMAPLQPIPQTPPGTPPPGTGGNWINRPGTSTSWTGDARGTPGDVITIPVSEGPAATGPAPADATANQGAGQSVGPQRSTAADGPRDIADLPPSPAGGS